MKGLEVPPYDPRANYSMAVNYATGPRGACHMRGYPMRFEQGRAMPEAGITHRQGRHDRGGKALAAATGEAYTSAQVLQTGERITNLQRLFNLRSGMTGADDTLPARLLEPLGEEPDAGLIPDLAAQMQEYYALHGWTAHGVPTAARLAELGL